METASGPLFDGAGNIPFQEGFSSSPDLRDGPAANRAWGYGWPGCRARRCLVFVSPRARLGQREV